MGSGIEKVSFVVSLPVNLIAFDFELPTSIEQFYPGHLVAMLTTSSAME
jgi:hypothetical protein